MVKTRHTADASEESPVTFISLNERKTGRVKANRQNDAEDSDDSGVVNFKQKKLLARKVDTVNPELKRSTRTAARRVTYVEDSLDEVSETDDEAARRKTKKAQHLVTIKDDRSETEDEGSRPRVKRGKSRAKIRVDDNEGDVNDADGNVSAEEESIRAHKGRAPRENLKTSVPEDTLTDHPAQRSSDYLVALPSPRQCQIDELADLDRGIRRSSRTRKLIYHTFNQKVLERCYELQQPPRKRCRMQAEENNMESTGDGYTDIYSRVKRQRKTVKRDMYGMPVETEGEEENEDEDDENDDTSEDNDEDDDESEDDEDDEEDDDGKADIKARGYNLRENKPRTQLYNAPVQEKRPRNQSRFFNDEVSTPHSPARRRRPKKLSYMSPARRRLSGSRRKRAFHGSSSTSSSSSDASSSDEEKFQRRKAKSMLKARQRCLPMNFDPDDIARSTVLRDRQKIGSSLADIDPMTIDRSITFDSIGGLGKHIRALKEMVVFPLLYPEVFERFKITPPRGVLFYGPPGTGKTLVARALANECTTDDRRVAFYMRKGADCLSKWVGESERQLRLLFDQAYQTRPSIIFFDELDGLAPVRSSRQDQIHSSIVSTLLALMDGLDSRGEIVVIGATNRLDSIDPALRRPGRFDREFLFPLPSVQARSQILKIHTKDWNPKLCDRFVEEVAKKCIGYCGADMKALCTEVALLALRRRYPQIYTSSEKLQIDVTSINVNAKDFHNAMTSIIPASQRSVVTPARALTVQIKPLLQAMFVEILLTLGNIFPFVLMKLANLDMPVTENAAENAWTDMDLCSDEEHNDGIFEQKINKRRKISLIRPVRDTFLDFASCANRNPTTHRPRMLLTGVCDQGQTSHLAPAVIHHLEQLPVHTLDLSSLYAVNSRLPEESCSHIFREARRTAPSIIYFPHINQWWPVVGETVRSAVMTFIQDFESGSPVLLLATSEEEYKELDCTLQDMFDEYSGEVFVMRNPNKEERHNFFKDLLLYQATIPPPKKKSSAQTQEILPKALPPEPRKLTDQELKKLNEVEEATLTELRLFLRDVLNKLGRDRKFFIFTKPVDIAEVPDYYAIIMKPMDLSTMMSKIDLHQYQSVNEFLEDIEQICLNALEYNPDKDQQSRVIRHRACALKDTAYAIIKTELDPEFEKICESIVESRKHRGEESTKSAPAFYHTKPIDSSFPLNKNYTSSYKDPHVRTSRRLQGANAFDVPPLEQVERSARTMRSLKKMSPIKENDNSAPQDEAKKIPLISNDFHESKESTSREKKSKLSSSSKTPTSLKKRKDVWGPSTYRSHRRKRKLKQHISSEEENLQDEQVMSGREDSEGENNIEIMESKGASVVEGGRSAQPVFVASSRPDSINEKKSSQENLSRRSAPVDLLLTCLSVDVNMKSSKDDSRSPYRSSPRAESQKSPKAVVNRSHDDSPSRLSSPGHYSARGHSSDTKSPHFHDNPASLVMEVSNRCPVRNIKLTKCNSAANTNRDSNEISAPIVTQDSLNAPQEVDQVKLKNNVVQMLVNDCVDSGIGSSESNGDSNDSQLISVPGNCDPTAGQSTTKSQDVAVTNLEKVGKCAEKQEKESISPVFHHTRSQNHTKTLEKTSEVIQELREPVIVDRERLLGLLEKTVLSTEDYTVPRLEKLYCLMAQCIYSYREDFNKSSMIEELEKRLKQYTIGITERMQREKTRALTSC